jgi:hypothetical protein
VRFERLVIEAGSNTSTLDLHPRLTVIAGVGRAERDALVAELLGAIASNRTGVHVEAVEDTGRRLAVFRPAGSKARVVDVDRAQDVTAQFLDGQGRINLLAGAGLDAVALRRKLRFGAADLQAASQGASLIRALADADQPALWAAAEQLLATEQALQTESDDLGTAPEDAELVDRVEARHHTLEAAVARDERLRRVTLVATAVSAVGALVASVVFGQGPAMALAFLACVAMVVAVYCRNRADAARKAEDEALAEAGANSYLGFHIQRVNGMLSSEQARKRLMVVADAHRKAEAAWKALAGDIPVSWAVDHHEEIVAAARVRIDISTHATMAPEQDGEPRSAVEDDTTDLARVLVGRLAELRRLGGGDESCPLLLDDPFADLGRGAKPALLELISHASGSPQLVYLTDDEDVASWARLEALTGALSIIEPAVEPAAADRERRRLTRSV